MRGHTTARTTFRITRPAAAARQRQTNCSRAKAAPGGRWVELVGWAKARAFFCPRGWKIVFARFCPRRRNSERSTAWAKSPLRSERVEGFGERFCPPYEHDGAS